MNDKGVCRNGWELLHLFEKRHTVTANCFGTLELWNLGTLELWKFGTFELGNLGNWELGNLRIWDFGNLGN